jgi:diphthamide synthase (EF-2-diphthine--ammonia ligase)
MRDREARRQRPAIAWSLFLADAEPVEAQLAGTGLSPLFPLWGQPTGDLAREMIDSGIEAIVTCVDTEQLDARFAGRSFDGSLLEDLPESVDPCAENGEFHTVVIAGPMFHERVDVVVGGRVDRGRFVFVDVGLRERDELDDRTN